MNKNLKFSIITLIINIGFSVYYVFSGIFLSSWWLFSLGFYYYILSIARFIVIKTKKNKHLLAKFTGCMLMIMAFSLVGVVVLSVVSERGHKFDMILMIAIATYSFAKITFAIIKLIKSRHSNSLKIITLRSISLANAFVSIFSMQRSMLVTFGEMPQSDIRLMNTLTGAGVCIIVFLIGLNLVMNKNVLFTHLKK